MNINLDTLEIINVIHSSDDDNITITPAERAYAHIKKAVSKYQKSHPEKCREKNKKAMKNLKDNKPEEYNEYLEKKRLYYSTVMKPRNQEKQKIKKEQKMKLSMEQKEINEKVRLAMEQDEIRSLNGDNDYQFNDSD